MCLVHPVIGITEETSAKEAVAAVHVTTAGRLGAEGLVPTSVTCVARSQSSGGSSLAAPSDWSHGAHWYRSSAVLLSYHK